MRRKNGRKRMSVINSSMVESRSVITPQKRDLNEFLLVLGCFLLLMLAGMGYALYLRLYCGMEHSTLRAHLLQWGPFITAVGALVFGLRRVKTDTKFAEFGLVGVFSVAMPVGYVLGRLLFF